MADSSLFGGLEFRETASGLGMTNLGEEEERIVSEVTRAACMLEDATLCSSADDRDDASARIGEGERANESRAAFGCGQTFEFAEQLGVVARVVARFAGVARRAHTGRAVESVDFQSGIVCEAPTAGVQSGFNGLLASVSGEVGLVFDHFGQTTDLARREHSNAERFEQPSNLTELLRVPAGEQ